MRRLWAHIILAAGILLAVCGSFVAVFQNARGNIEYTDGREITFQITELDNPVDYTGDESLAERASKVFEDRLALARVSKYSIQTSGQDIVKVSFAQDDNPDLDYQNVVDFLSSYGNKSLTNKSTIVTPLVLSEIRTGDAKVETTNEMIPSINIPIDMEKESNGYTLLKYKEETEKDESNAEITTTEAEEEGGEGEEVKNYYFYLWYDYEESIDSYEKSQSGSDDYDSNVAAKLSPIKFDCTAIDKDSENLTVYSNVDTDGDGSASEAEIKQAYKVANALVNVLNADKLDYKIKCIANDETHIANPEVEKLVSNGKVAWSKTLIATICAIVVISLLLVVFYRLGALSVSVLTILAVFSSAALIVAFGAEFTTAGIIGVLLVGVASLASGIVYLTKLKEDAYRGHTLKKANSEAMKKSLLPIVDINIVVIVTGIFLFLIGGSLFRTFAVATVIGGLISLVLNTLGLRALMWLATNTTGLIGKYEVFGIDAEKVPNHLAEEKQTYFGAYENKDFTKKKKPVGIVAASLFVVALVGLITFGTLTGGYLFNTGNKKVNYEASRINAATEIYIEETKINADEAYTLTTSNVDDILNDLLIYQAGVAKDKLANLSSIAKNKTETSAIYNTYEFTSKENNVIGEEPKPTVYHKYTVVELNQYINVDDYYVLSLSDVFADKLPLDLAFTAELENIIADKYISSVKPVSQFVTQNQPSFTLVMLGTFTAIAVLCVYFCLRYRLSRGLTSIIFPVVSSAIALGAYSLLRIVATSYTTIAIPVIAVFTMII